MINISPLAKEFYEKGYVASCPIIDCHAHMNPFGGGYMPYPYASDIVEQGERNNVILTLFSGHEALSSPRDGAHIDITSVREFPKKLKAYYAYNPNYETPNNAIDNFEKYSDVFIGFKLHPVFHNTDLNNDKYHSIMKYSQNEKVPILCHTWESSSQCNSLAVDKALSCFPKLIFLAGHSFYNDWQKGTYLANKYENLYLELTAALHVRDAIEVIVNKGFSERLLFGTDLPWFSTLHGVGCVMSSEISDSDRRNILYLNAYNIFNKYSWFKNLELDINITD